MEKTMNHSNPSTNKDKALRNDTTDEEEVDEEHNKWQKLNFVSRARYIFNNISVEPLLGFYIVSSVLGSLTTQNLNLQKACRVNLNMSDAVCTALEKRMKSNFTSDDEARVQELVTDMTMWQSIIQHTVPCIFVVFIGSWSDRTRRRKPVLLLPICGELVRVLGLLVCVYYFYELPMEVAGLVESLPSSLTGGWMIMFMAVFTYISDVTTVKMRTLRIGILNLSLTIGISFGVALSGIMYQKLGFYGIYSVCATMYTTGLIYGIIYLKDKRTNKPDNEAPAVCQDSKILAVKKTSFFTNAKDFFDLKHIKNAFGVTFKKGNDNRRLRIIMMMLVLMIIMGPMTGEMSVMYLSTRKRFNWDEVKYSMFSAFTMVTGFIGTSFSLWILSHKLQIDDTLIAVMACCSKVIGSFVFAFAPNEVIFFLGSIVEIIHGAGSIATRSIFTKLVTPDELGQVSAVVAVCEAFVPMVYVPMYSAFYKATMKTFPGAYFLLGGGLTIPAIFIFLWMYKGNKERARRQEENKTTIMQKKPDDTISISKTYGTSEKNGFTNLAFQSSDCTKN
ncbi:Major facilitator superfamily,Major facilitator superfamily domain [Cinara cedri]|uniref:Major facilitator superfamily,Major facilitator superfamily domain n=1 Tax=Cinara cedri TaxID=506608 RepID=A0A5E4MCN0_9HEMI|nr:Major facilitator superfamily,Major facilitator superfamily domain [Cinara cedri]